MWKSVKYLIKIWVFSGAYPLHGASNVKLYSPAVLSNMDIVVSSQDLTCLFWIKAKFDLHKALHGIVFLLKKIFNFHNNHGRNTEFSEQYLISLGDF